MSDPITPLLADMFESVVEITPVTRDGHGNATNGVAFDVNCHISGKSRLVRNREGQEVVSSYKLIVPGDNGLTVDDHLYTLPTTYAPNDRRKAIAIKVANDENGIHHQSVMLP